MSATIGNLNQLAEFMDAKLFTGSFRPVSLTQYVKVSVFIYVISLIWNNEIERLKVNNVRKFCVISNIIS